MRIHYCLTIGNDLFYKKASGEGTIQMNILLNNLVLSFVALLIGLICYFFIPKTGNSYMIIVPIVVLVLGVYFVKKYVKRNVWNDSDEYNLSDADYCGTSRLCCRNDNLHIVILSCLGWNGRICSRIVFYCMN